MAKAMFESNEAGYVLVKRGKVRDIYSVGNKTHLMIVATDRISAFDCVLPTPMPSKGIVLTQLSNFGLRRLNILFRTMLLTPIRHGWIGIMMTIGTTMK